MKNNPLPKSAGSWPAELTELWNGAASAVLISANTDLLEVVKREMTDGMAEVAYDVPGKGSVVECTVAAVKNGLAVNYIEPYMRRRDPDCMYIGDELPSDKPRYKERFGEDFSGLRQETFEWMKQQELIFFPFFAGRAGMGEYAMAVAPRNAAYFLYSLALLQGNIATDDLEKDFQPAAIIFVAPPFRHTHFKGRQAVVHCRGDNHYELFSFNLYPGPSAKKGVYGVLIDVGERERWVTAHCSAVQVVTPYDNVVTIMHEGASGGGKSEMLEYPHRRPDGQITLGKNTVTGEERFLTIPRTCDLHPVADDMALCHPSIQKDDGRLRIIDAEDGWFVRVNHIDEYGTDLNLEKVTARPKEPLVFMNIDAVPGSNAMIWDHTEDEPGKPCPNPRVIVPRHIIPNIVEGHVRVDIRSFGVRCPAATREVPSYGIIGLFHILPPALAWLWRLAAPRGHGNPSIIGGDGLQSEGVGSYWPFATGLRIEQANILLEQIEKTARNRFILCPNQHVGAWKTGFTPQWIAREYLARRGLARFRTGQLEPARSTLLGRAFHSIQVEGVSIPRWFLQTNTQPEVGDDGYDAGAEILEGFFREVLTEFNQDDLSPLGREIISCFMDGGKLEDYDRLIPDLSES